MVEECERPSEVKNVPAFFETVSPACEGCVYYGYGMKPARLCVVPGGFCYRRGIKDTNYTVWDLLHALGIVGVQGQQECT